MNHSRRLLFALMSGIFLLDAMPSAAQNLVAGDATGDVGAFVSVSIRVESAPNEASAFGFDVFFDPAVLRYADNFVEDELAAGFMLFDVNLSEPGRLRLGALTFDNAIAMGASGGLVTIDFEVLQCPSGGAAVSIDGLVDDVAGWAVFDGTVDCLEPALDLSDTTVYAHAGTGSLVVAVRNLLEGTLAWESVVISGSEWLSVLPESGTGDGELTISVLENLTGVERAGVVRVSADRSVPAFLDIDVVQSAEVLDGEGGISVGTVSGNLNDVVVVPLQVLEAPTDASAFGADIVYDASLLAYSGTFTRGAIVDDFMLFDINEAEPGRLRLGAVAIGSAISAGESGVLATVEFELIECGETDAMVNVIGQVDHILTWATAAGFVSCGAPALDVSTRLVRIPASSGSTTVSITNPGAPGLTWTAAVTSGSWLSVSPAEGNDAGMLTIRANTNVSSQSRGGTITIDSNGAAPASVVVEVIQAAASVPQPMGCDAGGAPGARGAWADAMLMIGVVLLAVRRRNAQA